MGTLARCVGPAGIGGIVAALLSVLLTSRAAAQGAPTTDRVYFTTNMWWFESDILLKLGRGFATQLDVQVRTAADQEGQPDRNALNVFENPYQFVLRPWLLYDLGETGIRFGVSPMAYGHSGTTTREVQLLASTRASRCRRSTAAEPDGCTSPTGCATSFAGWVIPCR